MSQLPEPAPDPLPVASGGAGPTRRPAGAVTAPAALVPAAVAGGLAAVAGAPVVAAVGVAVVAWAGAWAALAGLRRMRATRRRSATTGSPATSTSPYQFPEPWRSLLLDVGRAQRQFAEIAEGTDDGPLRSRLVVVAHRVDDGVAECWAIARRGTELSRAASQLDPIGVRRRLAVVEAQAAQPGDASRDADLRATVDALRAQLATIERVQQVAENARSHLQLLAARLGQASADVMELRLGQRRAGDIDALSDSVDAVVTELGVLRRAVAETDDGDVATGPG
jgi:hypothetical protein